MILSLLGEIHIESGGCGSRRSKLYRNLTIAFPASNPIGSSPAKSSGTMNSNHNVSSPPNGISSIGSESGDTSNEASSEAKLSNILPAEGIFSTIPSLAESPGSGKSPSRLRKIKRIGSTDGPAIVDVNVSALSSVRVIISIEVGSPMESVSQQVSPYRVSVSP